MNMPRYSIFALLGLLLAMLSGCSGLSGLDGSNKFSCAAASGVNCQSISGVSQNAEAGNLPFQRGEASREKQENRDNRKTVADDNEPPDYAPERLKKQKMSPADMRAIYTSEPLRQAPLVLRIWVAPFEDEEGDLHDQSIFYTQVHTGRWMVDSTQALIRAQYKPVYRLPDQNPAPSSGTEVGASVNPAGQNPMQQGFPNAGSPVLPMN
jgi:conjugal transfer pilus assembly protein TraV